MDGFESPVHERACWDALKTRAVPLKFAYAGTAAQTFDRLASEESYQEVAHATELETRALLLVIGETNTNFAVCEIGPGNGVHTVALLRSLCRAHHPVSHYLGLDFSTEVLSILAKRLLRDEPILSAEFRTWDFENSPTREIFQWRQGHSPIILLLVGNTIGNPESPEHCLRNLYESAQIGDYLLINAMLRAKMGTRELTRLYENSVFSAAALEPLRMLGIDLRSGGFEVRWDEPKSAVVGEFVLSTKHAVTYNSEILQFEPGERIRCFLSRRLDQLTLGSLLDSSGWQVLSALENHDGRHIAITARRRA